MNIRVKVVVLVTAVLFLAGLALVPRIIEARRANAGGANSQPMAVDQDQGRKGDIQTGPSVRNDTSKPLREMKQKPIDFSPEREANLNPHVPHFHRDAPDKIGRASCR